jgi:photosystem II stability/assembly factor-like uncharacterized protein
MKKHFIIYFIILLASCKTENPNSVTELDLEIKPKSKTHKFEYFNIPNTGIRALEVVDSNEIWYAGSNGRWGVTFDGGQTWKHDSIQIDTLKPEIRAIAVTKKAVHLLTAGRPGVMFRSTDKGENWKEVYKEDVEGVFYDAMAFGPQDFGIAVGDPVDGCFSIITTTNGGETWVKKPCINSPKPKGKEAFYAASNSNIKIIGQKIWIATGGEESRVFISNDLGDTWIENSVPIQKGDMKGIFSIDFYDAGLGFLCGGDWNNKEDNTKNMAITMDGGITWKIIKSGKYPGYRSCVKYMDTRRNLVSVGPTGVSTTKDGGSTWKHISDSSFYSVQYEPYTATHWMSGKNVIAKMK